MTALVGGEGHPDDVETISKFAFAYVFGMKPDDVDRMEAVEFDKWLVLLEEIGRDKNSNVPGGITGFAQRRMFK